jgi:inosine-uridine nucleoside N-ribohydrolase
MRVDIETASVLAAGQTVCDVWGQSGRENNVHVAKVRNPGLCSNYRL